MLFIDERQKFPWTPPPHWTPTWTTGQGDQGRCGEDEKGDDIHDEVFEDDEEHQRSRRASPSPPCLPLSMTQYLPSDEWLG